MATGELVRPKVVLEGETAAARLSGSSLAASRILAALSSLRLTVALFALSIFLVFVGTLAQVDHGVWHVVNHAYFRVWFARVDWNVVEHLVNVFHHVDWQLTGYFFFPGGKVLGCLLFMNLLTAHAVRFQVAARGRQLVAGLGVIGLGVLITWLVIRSGMNDALESELSPAFCNGLWHAMRASVGGLALVGAYLLVLSYGRARRLEWSLLLAVDVLLAVLTIWLFANPEARLDDSGLRILWQLIKGGAAGGVLLAGCVMAFRKRAGIVLLHGGVALMMFGELLTGITAEESQMTIAEGATTNFSQDIRTTELAVINHTSATEDTVTVVPQSLLAENVGKADRIEHAGLPFAIQVLRWMPNSQLRAPGPNEPNPSTAGAGLARIAESIPMSSGVDSDSPIDSPSAYVELFSKASGESLGTYLVSTGLLEQPAEVDGQTFDVVLRYKHIYWPYTLTLKDFRFDRYQGTNVAKNYSSLVQLKDPERHVDQEVAIWMNNPLRYSGTTFYQSSFDAATEQTTVLQVVTNEGWMIPYVSCMLVATGMLAHFGVALVRFSRRRVEEAARQTSVLQHAGQNRSGRHRAGRPTAWTSFARWFPVLVVVVFGVYIAGKARMPHSEPSEMQIYEFAKLPLAYQGRVKPYDTLARNMLQILSGRQQVIVEQTGGKKTKLPAIRWLLDAISGAQAADEHRVFRIDNLELLQVLGLKPREGSFRYSIADLRSGLGELDRQIGLASAQPEAQRSLFQRKVLGLADKLNTYAMLTQSFQTPQVRVDKEFFTQDLQQVQQDIARLQAASAPHAVPPRMADGRWMPLMEAELELLHDSATNQPSNPATVSLGKLLSTYAQGDATAFNRQLAEYRGVLADYEKSLTVNADRLRASGLAKAEVLSQKKINFEVVYNQFSPFYYAMVLYVVAFVLGSLSWLGWTEPLRRGSMWLLCFTLALHTFALVARIYISGRPPITNLYSTAIFIGWACVLLALVFEWLYRLGLGNIVAAVIGFLTLLVAYNLSLDGDTFIVLQAVLDTQFWLATHVVTINLGYATTYLAGTLGIAYVIFAHVFPALGDADRRQLTRMTYGTLCFAIYFSFVGTVLGGLWADDSWGRFWGWDPKENGALIIVLYNALVLHARWGGMVKERGLALLAIGGNIVTTWSYFGTNELGVGLHAYGASESSTAMWLLTFATSQFVLILLGAVPSQWYASFFRGRERASAP